MKAATLLLTFLLTCGSTFAKSEGPLNLTVPKGWHVTYQRDKEYFQGMPSYVLESNNPPNSVLVILHMGSSVSSSKIPSLLDASARIVAQDIERNPQLSGFDANFTTGILKGDVFSGKFAKFKAPSEDRVQTIVLISDGQTLLNATYNGPESGWKIAITILGTLREKRNTKTDTSP